MENKECSCNCGCPIGNTGVSGVKGSCSSESQNKKTGCLLKYKIEDNLKTVYLVILGNDYNPQHSPEKIKEVEAYFRELIKDSEGIGLALPHPFTLEILHIRRDSMKTIFKLGNDLRPVSDNEIKEFQKSFENALKTDGLLVTNLPVQVEKFFVEDIECQKS